MKNREPSRHTEVVLIGFTVEDELMERIAQRSSVMPTQTHRFAWNFTTGIQAAGIRVALVSVLPVPNYPEYPEIVLRSRRFVEHGVSGIALGFINLLVVKHLTRLYACIVTGHRFIVQQRCETVVVHGVHTPFLFFAVLLKHFRHLTICLVMTDPPGLVREVDGVVARRLKAVDRRIVRRLASNFDGVISLTPDLADDFAPGVKKLVMEGFADSRLADLPQVKGAEAALFRIAYAGGISDEYGVRNLVTAFRSLEGTDLRLDLFGKGPLDSWVIQQCAHDDRIRHHGALSHGSLMPLLRNAALLVNPRPAAQDFVRYSFPSKLLEYLALGVPVVTTKLPGIPDAYLPFLLCTRDDSTRALASAISEVWGDRRAATNRARLGQRFVLAEKSVFAQGERVAAFIRDLNTSDFGTSVINDRYRSRLIPGLCQQARKP